MKLIVFGVGRYFSNRKSELFHLMEDTDEIVAFVDNAALKVKWLPDIQVHNPMLVKQLDFDAILLMCANPRSMKDQLLALGVDKEKLYTWEKYKSLKSSGEFKLYIGNSFPKGKKKILIISTGIHYNGASLAAIYAAKALLQRGYDVCLAAPEIERGLDRELIQQGMNAIVLHSLPYVGSEELYIICKFDIVLVNVFQMIETACGLPKYRPLLWWIHEPNTKYEQIYEKTRCLFSEHDNMEAMNGIRIYTVSRIAQRNFEMFFPHRVDGILPFGIPDEVCEKKDKNKPIVFAIIGQAHVWKGQKTFIKAAKRIIDSNAYSAEFWLIGGCGNDPYGQEVQEMARALPQVRLLGVMHRDELRNTFQEIDCVVCASLEETMSLTITEGMMHGKVCITTDATGIAEYIQDGVNGLVCEAGSAEALREKMEWVLEHQDALESMRRKARETYEAHFTMEAFGDRLEEALLKTEAAYWANRRQSEESQ